MLTTARTLSLIEQKRLQWAREKEEMVGLYGLWGKSNSTGNKIPLHNKSNRLPPLEGKGECEDQIKADESETSGYLSDSPKHLNEKELNQEHHYIRESSEELDNETPQQQQYWNEVNLTDRENSWTEKKILKNLKNENWAHQNTDSLNQNSLNNKFQSNRNFWHGTPDSLSSDEGSRLRWGDRGVGIGHLWEPVIDHPDCRLPLVADPYRQTPKWVEKGLKNADGNKADILIIHHPDEGQCEPLQKNYLLGQNVFIPPEVIEERENRRKKALENQNAIKKQLEERELKRRQEKENKIREERLEEERIKKEQEIERLRYEDEQRKMKIKEENEKKKEEIMREAIELAEKRAKEEKRLSKRRPAHMNYKNLPETEKKLERILEQPERSINQRKFSMKIPKYRKTEETADDQLKMEDRHVKDSSSQCEDIQLAQNFQYLNLNGMPLDGGLALVLDPPTKDSNFLLPPDGVQLALLMSPRTATATGGHKPTTPMVLRTSTTEERILTPSKYRVAERLRFHLTSKSTQTDFKHSFAGFKTPGIVGKGKKYSRMSGIHSGSSGGSQKCSGERHYKHIRCFLTSKYRSKNHSSKSLEDRPKWGINRPLVQYKKQSEKDPYYQKKMKERLKKAEAELHCLAENAENAEEAKEKEMTSAVRLIEYQTDEDENETAVKEDIVLENGYRMNSNLSSPVFVPIGNRLPEWESKKKVEERLNDSNHLESCSRENSIEEEENAAVPGSIGFLTQTQLESIRQIASLREGLKKFQKDYSTSQSTSPFSERSVEK